MSWHSTEETKPNITKADNTTCRTKVSEMISTEGIYSLVLASFITHQFYRQEENLQMKDACGIK